MKLPEAFEHHRVKQAGFTLIELMIVLAILIMIAAMSLPLYGNLQASGQLNETTAQLAQATTNARVRALAGVNDTRHGIYVDTVAKTYTLYQGDTYATRNSSHDRITQIESGLSISTTFSGDEVTFLKGTGVPSESGSMTLIHSATNNSKTVSVNSLGIIDED